MERALRDTRDVLMERGDFKMKTGEFLMKSHLGRVGSGEALRLVLAHSWGAMSLNIYNIYMDIKETYTFTRT